jgi:threonine dehydratase
LTSKAPSPKPSVMAIHDLPFRLDVRGAVKAVAPFIRRTPVMRAPDLEEARGCRVFLKLENLQTTGSFKIRGAANRILALTAGERERGVVACSSGNHGRAVAHMAGALAIPAVICVPSWVDPVKLAGMERAGARVVLAGDTYDEAEARALALAEEYDRAFIQPFDDPLIAAGQGTLGVELLQDIPELTTVIVPLSGGGLAGGIAYALKEARPEIRVLAVSAARARVMYESLKVGKPVSMPEEETVAEALSGGIGATNRYTLPLIRELVDEHILVQEEEIRKAMLHASGSLNILVEGGGAVALAAVLGGRCDMGPATGGDTVAVILSGGNVSLPRLQRLAEEKTSP